MRDASSPWLSLTGTARRVVLEVLLHGPLARTEVANRLKLSTPSLTRITKPLLDAGILRELPVARTSDGGRPLQPLDVNPDRQHFVGIKVERDRAYGVLTNLRADVLACGEIAVADPRPDDVVEQVAALAGNLAGARSAAAVGVSVGGPVRGFSYVESAHFLQWQGVDLGRLLAKATRCPAVVANDVEALAEAEHWFGAGRGLQSFAVVTTGAGVGYGLVVHGQLVSSPDSGRGLLGHFPIDPLGPACPAGHRGCADVLMTTGALQTRGSLALGRSVSFDEVLELAGNADPVAYRLVADAAGALGTLVAAIANIAQTQRVILTGEGIGIAEVGRGQLDLGIARGRNSDASPVDVRVMPNDPSLWARGAASVAIQRTVLGALPAVGHP